MSKSSSVKNVDKDQTRLGIKRIRWCFRCNASINDEPNEQTDREDHAQFLVRQLKQYCASFVFQLESAPTTGMPVGMNR